MHVTSLRRRRAADTLYDFVTCSAELLASDDEPRRRHLEDRLQALFVDLRDTPAFDVFTIRGTALRAMLHDGDPSLPVLAVASNHPSGPAW